MFTNKLRKYEGFNFNLLKLPFSFHSSIQKGEKIVTERKGSFVHLVHL